jgi:hypothetical protein
VPGSVYHVFTNAIPDGTNSSIVRPSDWNSSHALTLNAAGSEISRAFEMAAGSPSARDERQDHRRRTLLAHHRRINFSCRHY